MAGCIEEKKNTVDDETAEQIMQAACSSIEAFFRRDDWKYKKNQICPYVTEYSMGVSFKKSSMSIRICVDGQIGICRVETDLQVIVEPMLDYLVCEAIAKKNYSIRFGAFQYDKKNRAIVFRYCFPVQNGVREDDFGKILYWIASSADKGYKDIRRCCTGKFAAEELETIKNNVIRLENYLDTLK